MLLNLNTGYAVAHTDFCIRIMFLCCYTLQLSSCPHYILYKNIYIPIPIEIPFEIFTLVKTHLHLKKIYTLHIHN